MTTDFSLAPPVIAVDARSVFTSQPRGIGKSLSRLYQNMARLRPDWQFYFYNDSSTENAQRSFPSNIKPVTLHMRGDRWNLWEQVRFPLEMWRRKTSLAHCPAQTAPMYVPVPYVVTIHDIIPLTVGDGWGEVEIEKFRKNISRVLASASRVITISNHTKLDILREFPGVPEENIDVVYWGTSLDFSTGLSRCDEVTNKYDLGEKPYFLVLGGESPRKNIPLLLEAYRQYSAKGGDWNIVIVGLQLGFLEKLEKYVHGWACQARIKLRTYVEEQDIPVIFQAAGVFVFPSTYEGFGLPVLDAMSASLPVISSNVSCMPEIAGDAALYFSPDDSSELAEKMYLCSESESLRSELSQKSLRQADRFSWENTAVQTLRVFEGILGA